MALELFNEDHEAAEVWLSRSLPVLEGESPVAMTKTEHDFKQVVDLVGRLKAGVFS